MMEAHFVEFYSPGTFFEEVSERPIDSWDVEQARAMAEGITERYGQHPYGFRLVTRERADDELDSHVSHRSNMYYLAGEILTLKDVEARSDPRDETLRINMRTNQIGRVIETNTPARHVCEFKDGDVLLEPAS